jgi:hypothetical protein
MMRFLYIIINTYEEYIRLFGKKYLIFRDSIVVLFTTYVFSA